MIHLKKKKKKKITLRLSIHSYKDHLEQNLKTSHWTKPKKWLGTWLSPKQHNSFSSLYFHILFNVIIIIFSIFYSQKLYMIKVWRRLDDVRPYPSDHTIKELFALHIIFIEYKLKKDTMLLQYMKRYLG